MTAAKSLTQNRRHSPRKQPRQAIKVQCRRGSFGFGLNVAETFLDLSEGGVRLVVRELLEVNQVLEIRLEGINLTRPVIRVGKVVWALPLESGQYCVGLKFDKNLAYADLQRIAKP